MSARPGIRHISQRDVERLAEGCSQRDLAIIETVHRLHLVTGEQLERLHFTQLSGRSRAVTRWRVLHRLTEWRLIAPLERRIGGAARGSAGTVYALDAAGQRLLNWRSLSEGNFRRTRRPHAPTLRTMRHTLAIAELYVRLRELENAGGPFVEAFLTEPACWHPNGVSGTLKPDAFTILATADLSDLWWIEVDLSTESLPTLAHKLSAYLQFWQRGGTGPQDTMPRVLVSVPDERRLTSVQGLVDRLQDVTPIVHVVLHERAAQYMVETLTGEDGRGS